MHRRHALDRHLSSPRPMRRQPSLNMPMEEEEDDGRPVVRAAWGQPQGPPHKWKMEDFPQHVLRLLSPEPPTPSPHATQHTHAVTGGDVAEVRLVLWG